MKKIILALILSMIFVKQSFACVCAAEVSLSFSTYENEINANLNMQKQSINKLNQSVKESSKILLSQNEILNKNNAVLQENLVKDEALLFELRKKNNLK